MGAFVRLLFSYSSSSAATRIKFKFNAEAIFNSISTYSQLLLYRTLGYTGIRTHTGPRISVPQNFRSSQYVLYSPVFGYTEFLIYRTLNISPNQSGIRAIVCID